MILRGVHSVILGALIWLSGCVSNDNPLAPECRAPVVASVTLGANPGNALSVGFTAHVAEADSVMFRFGTGAMLDSLTPAFDVTRGSAVGHVLGLLPETSYRLQLVALNRCGLTAGEVLPFVTGSLPDDLPRYVAWAADPSSGYVVFAAGSYGVVIDNTGRVAWYHRFTNGPGLNFQPQPNGRYAARPSAPPGEPGVWLEIDPSGELTRSLRCARGLQPRMHDMIAAADGSYWLLCDEIRNIDLSSAGGAEQAPVLGTAVQHISATGEVLFDWSPFDHLPIDPVVLQSAERVAGVINWTHGNALDVDSDGNLFVSFRNLSEIVKVDTRTGIVRWRMGGGGSGFGFQGVAIPAFARQHGVRYAGSGRVLLLDNLGDPTASRVELYELDEGQRIARLVRSYASPDAVVGTLGGNVQVLPRDRTLVSFGNGAAVEEFDAAGRTVWRLVGDVGYVFRAQRITSLYKPGAGDPR